MTPDRRRPRARAAALALLVMLAGAAPRIAAQDMPGAADDGADDALDLDAGAGQTMFSTGDDDWSSRDASDRGTASLGDGADRDRAFGSFRGAGGSFDEGGHPRF